jgi:hypothetical protein
MLAQDLHHRLRPQNLKNTNDGIVNLQNATLHTVTGLKVFFVLLHSSLIIFFLSVISQVSLSLYNFDSVAEILYKLLVGNKGMKGWLVTLYRHQRNSWLWGKQYGPRPMPDNR